MMSVPVHCWGWAVCRRGNSLRGRGCVGGIDGCRCGTDRHYSTLAVLPHKLQKVFTHQRLSLRAFCGSPQAVSRLRPPPQEPHAHLSALVALYLTRTFVVPVFSLDKQGLSQKRYLRLLIHSAVN